VAKALTPSSASIIVLVALVTAACDGYIGVEGRAYEWVGAGEADRGYVVIDSLSAPLPAQLVAVPGVEVVVEPWTPGQRANISRPELWTERAKTDSTGYFKTGTTAKPGKYDATITVAVEGYDPLQTTFRHDRFRHHAIVILVRSHRGAEHGPQNNELQRTKPAQAMELRR
jgi:hypothetical protein